MSTSMYMSQKWPPNATRALAKLYKSHPILYQTSSINYHNRGDRFLALKKISAELENLVKKLYSVDDILKKINNMRTQFLEALKQTKMKQPHGSGVATWWLFDEMTFLMPHINKNRLIPNRPARRVVCEAAPTGFLNENDKISEISNDHSYSSVDPLSVEIKNEIDCSLDDSSFQSTTLDCVSVESSEDDEPPEKKKLKFATEDGDDAIGNRIACSKYEIANSELPADVQAFLGFVGHELATIQSKELFTKCKWDILRLIQDAQNQDNSFAF